MTGKFSNTVKVSNNENNSNNSNNANNSILRGIPVVVITTPYYIVRIEDMGCMLLVSANCTLDFTNINETSTCIVYIINKAHEFNEVNIIVENKEIVGSHTIANDMNANFITVHKGKVYTYKAF